MRDGNSIGSLVVKVAALCNLNCTYCYMYHHEDTSYLTRPKLMAESVFEQLLERMLEHCEAHNRQMSLTFHGGEPTLLPSRHLGRYASRAREVLGDRLGTIGMQTNGTLVNEEWVKTCQREKIAVGVSLDGPAEINDATRVDHSGLGSHDRAVRGLKLLQKGGVLNGVLCVVNPRLDGVAVYDYFRELGVQSISFLLPDITHDSKERLYGGIGPTPVADYLIPVFDRWFQEDDPEVVVRLFWELIAHMFGGMPGSDAFGNGPLSYVIIETDGAIQPVDTLRACEEGMIETNLNVNEHGFDDLNLGPPLLRRLVHTGTPLAKPCISCREREICGGGYITHRYSRENGFDNPSAWCDDIYKLLSHIRSKVTENCSAPATPSPSMRTASATHS